VALVLTVWPPLSPQWVLSRSVYRSSPLVSQQWLVPFIMLRLKQMPPIPILDDDAISARIDAIDVELAQNTGADREALEEERQSLEDQIIARGEYDRNEDADMSSPDATIDAGRSSRPIDKLRDKIADRGTPKQDEQQQQQQDHEQQQSKPEPNAEPDAEPETNGQQPESGAGETTGIRTVQVVEVTVTPGPHATPGGGNTQNQQQPETMRTLGRRGYEQEFTSKPNIWQYPGSAHNTDQIGLVQQSYKSYFGMH